MNRLRLVQDRLSFHLVQRHPGVHLALVAVLIGCVAWYWFFVWYSPSLLARQQQEQELAALVKQHNNLTVALTSLATVSADLKHYNHALSSLLRSSSSSCVDTCMTSLLQEAQRAALAVEAFEAKQLSSKKSYAKHAIMLRMKGSFNQVLDFLDRATASCGVLRYHSCSLERVREGELAVTVAYTLYTKGDV